MSQYKSDHQQQHTDSLVGSLFPAFLPAFLRLFLVILLFQCLVMLLTTLDEQGKLITSHLVLPVYPAHYAGRTRLTHYVGKQGLLTMWANKA